uniref:Non-structural maintenance of chromosomes element 4 n=1 Tax=Myotis myotis TaxID=51298 RepID=A0A7J7QW80_MYOMY|nr:NSE4-like protein A, SMC5-SMC6 complex component [Myotis myotis]
MAPPTLPHPPSLGASGSGSSGAGSAGPGGPTRGGAPGCTWDLQGTGHTCPHSVLWLLKCRGHGSLNSWGLASARCTYRCGFRLHRAFWEGVGQGAQGLCWSHGPPRTPVRRLVPTGAAAESTFSVRLGSIQGECPVPKPRAERPRRICALEKEREMPVQLKRMEESQQEATEKEVERILGLLQTYFREDPDTPMSFFDFVVDPHSFPRTVENIFHVSFIVRDGFARIKLDQDRLPIIEPVNEESEGIDQNTQIRNQGIIALSYRDWEEIVRTFEISEPVIVSGPSRQSLSADGS